jgi:hypothetical protein
MRFAVDAWDPSYGTSESGSLEVSEAQIAVDVEVPASQWRPLDPRPPSGATQAPTVWFVDGVRRVDARLWIDEGGGAAAPAIAASYGAGVVRCNGSAQVVRAGVERVVVSASPRLADIATTCGPFRARQVSTSTPEALSLGLQEAMTEAEIRAAEAARAGEPGLLAVDGPLRGRQHLPDAVGCIKTHHVEYLPPALQPVLGLLAARQRTPLFLVGGRFTRLSWYLRLPGPVTGPRSCLLRCEIGPERSPAEATALADLASLLLPRYASAPHKDARAPQNLVPVAGLERELRRRLGDAALVLRALRTAAAGA